nr:phospholipase-like protein [Tanacetum cinerariifolium]
IGHNNLHESDREFIFNKWILDSYDVEEEYAREIGNPYSIRFNEFNRVFNNEIEHFSNENILRIRMKGYVLDDVWGKCQQNYKKTNEAWHDEGYKEDEMWRSGDEKTDYDPPYVNVKTFEVKKYAFKGGHSFICITNREDDALPLGRVNEARFKAMIRKELEGNKYVHEVT